MPRSWLESDKTIRQNPKHRTQRTKGRGALILVYQGYSSTDNTITVEIRRRRYTYTMNGNVATIAHDIQEMLRVGQHYEALKMLKRYANGRAYLHGEVR